MKKNYPYLGSIMLMFVLSPLAFTVSEVVLTIQGIHMLINMIWTAVLLIRK